MSRPLPRPRASARLPISLLALVLAVGACDVPGSGGGRVELSEREEEEILEAIPSEDGSVDLVLSAERLFLRLSDETRARAEEEMARDLGGEEGIAGAVASAVSRGVSRALGVTVSWELEEIREIRLDDGRLVVELRNGSDALEEVRINDRDVARTFEEEDVRRVIEAFEEARPGG